MGFKKVDHRFGAVLFLILFVFGIIGFITAKQPEYQMAYIGSLIWVFGKFSYEKNLDDKKGRAFCYFKYLDAEWDNLAINLAGIHIVVPQMYNIAGLQDKVEFTDLWYYGAGILTDGLYILVVFVAKLKKKYEGTPLLKIEKDEEADIN
ncbi:MAG TPA: hypothetical protein VIL29_10165 [Pseudothermotoga sp.]